MNTNLVKGEALRQLTSFAPWIILALGLTLTLVMPFLTGYNIGGQYAEEGPGGAPAFVHDYVFSFAGRVGYFAPLLLGVMVVVADTRDGAMSKLVTFARGRLPALGVKTTVLLAGTAVLGTLMVGANALGGWLGLRAAFASHPSMMGGDTAMMMLRTVVVFLLWALVGIGLGMLIRSQVFAMVIVFVFVLFVEPILTVMAHENSGFAAVGKFLPGALNWAIVWPVDSAGGTGPVQAGTVDPLSVATAILVLALYSVLVYALGALFGVFRRELPM